MQNAEIISDIGRLQARATAGLQIFPTDQFLIRYLLIVDR